MRIKDKETHWTSFSNKKPKIKIQMSSPLISISQLHARLNTIQSTPLSSTKKKIRIHSINHPRVNALYPLSVSPRQLKERGNKNTKKGSKKVLQLVYDIEQDYYNKYSLSVNKHVSLKNLPTMTTEVMSKESLRVLPKLSTKTGINNFLIRNNNSESEPEKIIKSCMNKKTVTEHFFNVEGERRKSKAIQLSKEFHILRSCNQFNDHIEQRKEESSKEAPTTMTKSEKDYAKAKENLAKALVQKNEEKALVYANLVFKNRKTDQHEQNDPKNKIILRNNLMNIIYLRKILKTEVSLLTEEEEIGIGAIKDMKNLNKEVLYNSSRVLRHCSPPNFIKNKLRLSTHRRFHSVRGKYFGVVC